VSKHLFIIITRMYAKKGSNDDEFVNEWKLPKDKEYVFFTLESSDVLLIHGYSEKYQGSPQEVSQRVCKEIRQYLERESVKLEDYSERYILYHPQPSFTLSCTLTRTFTLQTYSTVTGGPFRAIESLKCSPEVAEELKNFFFHKLKSYSSKKLSILKHRIVHLFLPIDIDLQGLIEMEFQEDYWNEVVEAWNQWFVDLGKSLDELQQAIDP